MRIVFFGTPQLSVPTLQALVEAGYEVPLVVTQADKRRGRGSALTPSPIKAAAQQLGLNVSHRVKDSLDVNAELGVLVAFGRIIKPEILDSLNILNLHPSLLPRWRGATPVEAAILAGDTKTGICIMQLQNEMDAGPIYARWETPVDPSEKAADLYGRLFEKGNAMLTDLLSRPLPEPQPQEGEATFCGKITPDDMYFDSSTPPERVVALTRIGRAWTTFREKRLIVHDAAIVGQGLRLITVQPEGKAAMTYEAWANGVQPRADEPFGHS